ncbi:MAG: MBL fold metallo-hydrolase [Conexivisphaera sp.]
MESGALGRVVEVRVPIPIPLRYVNVYAVECGEEYALIDSGMASFNSAHALYKGLRSSGVDPRRISRVYLTHSHADHATMAPLVHEISGADLFIGRRELEATRNLDVEWVLGALRDGYRRHGAPEGLLDALTGRHPISGTAGMYRELASIGLRPVDDGERLPCGLTARSTPGHTPGHVVYVGDGAAFTGDHLLPGITSNVSWFPMEGFDALGEYMRSLRSLADMGLGRALPGHGDGGIPDVRGRAEEVLRHHVERLEEVLRALEGPSTAYEVASSIRWSIGSFDALDPYNRIFALGEALSHLVHLEAAGKVEEVGDAPVRWRRIRAGRSRGPTEHF